ncbi:MAG: chorismate pyruvate-lyase family protein [Candidatus Nitrosocaldus sp.]
MIERVSVKVSEGEFGSTMLRALRRLEERSEIKLSRVEKLLLAEVGTVEQLLSILIDEPVSVCVLKQEEDSKSNIIERRVNIRNADSILMSAESRIRTDVLPEAVVDDIRARKLGIGSIILKHRLETFRRIVEIGCCYSSDESRYSSSKDRDASTVYRLYSIVHAGVEAFMIREEFRSDAIRRLASLT